MISVEQALQRKVPARDLAQAVLAEYFCDRQVAYPINPFQMLTDYGVPFVFRPFSGKKCEGMYLPAQGKDDIAVVGINIKRPITRQRYTAAHELCHHIKDNNSPQICDINGKDPIEKYAENFAAELLMPYKEMDRKICEYASSGCLSFDDVLEIAEYFGVSFLSCLFRVAWVYHKISGDTSSRALRKRAQDYHAEKQREKRGYSYVTLYEQIVNADEKSLCAVVPTDFIKAKYCNNYVYNDSRLEGVDVNRTEVAEIVTDIRLHGDTSPYCNEGHETEIAVAGHAKMYEYLFSMPQESPVDIFTIVQLHRQLYSCAPAPEFGGSLRTGNTLVMGAKFETVDYQDIIPQLLTLSPAVSELLKAPYDIPLSDYVEKVAEIHHKLTVIHPFGDGNGRTTRAFLNLLLMRRGLLPIYIRVEEKSEYKNALAKADTTGDYRDLYIVLFKALMRAQAEFTEAPPLG